MNTNLRLKYNAGHIIALDGLRGVATILVLLYHFFTWKVPFGWMGVDLFFVLSGFLITGILIKTKDSPDYYKNFIVKRVLRIFPLYYFFLIIFFIVFSWTNLVHVIKDYDYLRSIQVWYWLYAQNWLIFFDPIYPNQEIISHFWSLAIEEQFYIFWPLLIYLIPNEKITYACIGIIALSIVLRLIFKYQFDINHIKIYVFTFTRLDGLAVGSALAALMRNEKHVKSLNRYVVPVFIASAIIVLSIIVIHRSFDFEFFTTYGYTAVAIFFGCLILIALSQNNFIQRSAENKVLVFFGKYSYGIYVYHIPVFRIFAYYLTPWIHNRFVISIVCIIISIGVAYLSYHLIEKHFLKLKKTFQPGVRKISIQ